MHDADDARSRRRTDFDEAFSLRHARLRTLRLHVGLSEAEMAGRMGIDTRAWRRWETPKRSDRGAVVFFVRLAEQFGVSIEWLVVGGQRGAPRNDDIPQAPGGTPLPLPTRH